MRLRAGQRLTELPSALNQGFGAAELRDVVCERREERRMVFGLQVAEQHVNVLQTMHGAFAMLLLDVLTTLTILQVSARPTVSVHMAGAPLQA